jgi:hypothetical protein
MEWTDIVMTAAATAVPIVGSCVRSRLPARDLPPAAVDIRVPGRPGPAVVVCVKVESQAGEE